MITSASNKKIKNVMLLLSKSKERKKQGLFVTEGIKMFLEAPEDWLKEIYLSEELWDGSGDNTGAREREAAKKLSRLKERGDMTIEIVKGDVFRKMCDTKTPQGILCVMNMPEYDLAKILGNERICGGNGRQSGKDPGLYLILEDIQDPGNLGTMIRSGEGAGITGVIMSANTVDLFNPKTVRATMGSIYRVPFVYTDDLAAAVCTVKKAGVKTYAAHLEGTRDYDREDYRKAAAFLIGNEGNGLTRETADLADHYIKIPMCGRVESLNAAIAATLLTYEAARQRRN